MWANRMPRRVLPVRRADLPVIDGAPADVSIVIPDERTCAFGDCSLERRSPVILIHGHSFAESTDPNYNIQSMTPLAFALEPDYLYAGHLFPETRSALAELEAPVAFTATYYVNTYEADGQILRAPFKSEPIESYAIRLSETIDEALELSGADQVTIVAHSMGGLVARSYLDVFGSEKVSGLIMIGTPNHGVRDRIVRICPVLGASLECRDMSEGSVFLRKLNREPLPDIPITTIVGRGCSEGDGVVPFENAVLAGANITIIGGNCTGTDLLHNAMLDPEQYPEVAATVRRSIQSAEEP